MRNLFFILVVLAILSACATEKKCRDKYPCTPQTRFVEKILHDTVEKIHDSLIHIPADSSYIIGLLKCDSTGRAYLAEILELKNGKNIKTRTIIKNNKIYLGCEVDSASVYLHWKEKHIKSEIKTNYTVVQSTAEVKSPGKLITFLYVLRWIWDIWWLIFLVGWILMRRFSRKLPNY